MTLNQAVERFGSDAVATLAELAAQNPDNQALLMATAYDLFGIEGPQVLQAIYAEAQSRRSRIEQVAWDLAGTILARIKRIGPR